MHRAGDAGFVRIFLDAGAPMTGLLGSLTGPGAERAQRVLSSEPAAGAQPLRNVSGPDELSDRELDVLRLLRSDLSGPEIARQLHVSLNTLRTHTKHIYTKLSATNRREAVSRATELDL